VGAEVGYGEFAVCGVPDSFQHVGDFLDADVLPVLQRRPAGACLFGFQNLLELWQLFPFHRYLLFCHFA
jgi:hypothetical protein